MKRVLAAVIGLAVLAGCTSTSASGGLLAPPEGVAEQYDPHVWFDVAKWQTVSRTIADTLSERDPARAADYQANPEAYLAELDAYITEQIATIPQERRLLVTSHDAFEYLGQRYGMDVAGIQGISTAAEATTADIEGVAGLVAAAGQRGATVTVGGELYTDAAGDPGTEAGIYIGMLRANTDLIVEGLT